MTTRYRSFHLRRPGALALPGAAASMAALILTLAASPARAQQAVDEVLSPAGRPQRSLVVESEFPRLWQVRRGGYLGLHLLDLTPELRTHFGVDESAGVMVATVAAESPAAAAGLEVGDIITTIDGEAVVDRLHLARQVGRHEKGDTVTLEVFRDGGSEVLQATVDERDRPQLWLKSLDNGSGHSIEWQTDDEGVLVVPSPGGSRVEITGDRLDQVMGRLHERLASPDFHARMLEFNSNTEELERRIRELEERLAELSKQLEELDD